MGLLHMPLQPKNYLHREHGKIKVLSLSAYVKRRVEAYQFQDLVALLI